MISHLGAQIDDEDRRQRRKTSTRKRSRRRRRTKENKGKIREEVAGEDEKGKDWVSLDLMLNWLILY